MVCGKVMDSPCKLCFDPWGLSMHFERIAYYLELSLSPLSLTLL
jgi:hypothetical protein